MGGWKTWVAAIGLMLTGLGMIAAGVAADPLNPDQIWEGILLILAGLGMIGIGHKIEKAGK